MTGVPALFPGDPGAFWDARFRESGYAYGEQPNDFLQTQAAALLQGRALCLAEGEGRNAVHLAVFEPEPESFDLVVTIWMHLQLSLRADTHQRARSPDRLPWSWYAHTLIKALKVEP